LKLSLLNNGFLNLKLAICIVMLTVMNACTAPAGIKSSNDLQPVQVKEYQGEKLSSITDFRENSIKGVQYIDENNYELRITGLVKTPASYSYNDILNNYRNYSKLVTLDCVEGWSVKLLWEGVRVSDLVQKSEALPDAKMIIFHAYDGYTTSLPLNYVLDKQLLLAYKINGVTLPPDRGFPFQLVAEDKWGYKWIKWVNQIELSSDENYRGYWEKGGYSNDASLDKPFFDR
jgi:DMSO/TMAO reductase YedYZ molybdopterin-dependent catalytic subunit